jgi:hypothetical protein
MKPKPKKLVLSAQTVRQLSADELTRVPGGAASSWESCKCSFSQYEDADCDLSCGARTSQPY